MVVMLAGIIDWLIGDPQSKFHPVALMGRLIGIAERIFYPINASKEKQFIRGAAASLMVLFSVYMLTDGIVSAVRLFQHTYAAYAAEAVILSFMICPRSLAKAAEEISRCLLCRNIQEARVHVGWIVGRDTAHLDEEEIVRATVETVAESTVDGILSPLFFFLIGGVPLAALYRAANTLDSMIGYKNEKYMYFGRFAARLDDVLNFIPARLSVILFTAAAFVMQYHWIACLRTVWRDAAKHPSPNGGYAEAAVAGALGIRLGGYNSYFGQLTFRAYMGKARYKRRPVHIKQTVNLMYIAAWTAIGLAAWITW